MDKLRSTTDAAVAEGKHDVQAASVGYVEQAKTVASNVIASASGALSAAQVSMVVLVFGWIHSISVFLDCAVPPPSDERQCHWHRSRRPGCCQYCHCHLRESPQLGTSHSPARCSERCRNSRTSRPERCCPGAAVGQRCRGDHRTRCPERRCPDPTIGQRCC